jgi:hypothetical protein
MHYAYEINEILGFRNKIISSISKIPRSDALKQSRSNHILHQSNPDTQLPIAQQFQVSNRVLTKKKTYLNQMNKKKMLEVRAALSFSSSYCILEATHKKKFNNMKL